MGSWERETEPDTPKILVITQLHFTRKTNVYIDRSKLQRDLFKTYLIIMGVYCFKYPLQNCISCIITRLLWYAITVS
jgi:hypothetical protein